MTLLSRDEVQEIRKRAAANECTAEDVGRLLSDLAEGPPRIFIAPQGASEKERVRQLRKLAEVHRCAVYVLPHGWIETNAAQRDVFERAIRSVARDARERCAKIVERGDWPDGLPSLLVAVAAEIRALNEVSP